MHKNITANLGVSMTRGLLGDVNHTYTTYLDIAQQIKAPRIFSKVPLGGIVWISLQACLQAGFTSVQSCLQVK